MKIFQVFQGLIHAEFSQFGTIDSIPVGTFPQTLLDQMIEAPDHIFVGWGYSNGEYIKPSPPEGYEYDDNSGTFYPVAIGLLAQIQHNTWGKTHDAVDNNIITEEIFKQITGEDYIPHVVG